MPPLTYQSPYPSWEYGSRLSMAGASKQEEPTYLMKKPNMSRRWGSSTWRAMPAAMLESRSVPPRISRGPSPCTISMIPSAPRSM